MNLWNKYFVKKLLFASANGGYSIYWAIVIGIIIMSAYMVGGLIPKRFVDVRGRPIVVMGFRPYTVGLPVLQLGKLIYINDTGSVTGSSVTGGGVTTNSVTGGGVTTNSVTKPPADIMLVFDTSTSMSGEKLLKAKEAGNKFIDIIAQNPKMRVGVANFDYVHGKVDLSFTGDFQAAKNAVNNLRTAGRGGTCITCPFDDLTTDSDTKWEFANRGIYPRKIVILLSDGEANRYIEENGSNRGTLLDGDQQRSRDQAYTAITGLGVEVWIVDYGGRFPDYLQSMISGEGEYRLASSAEFVTVYDSMARKILK